MLSMIVDDLVARNDLADDRCTGHSAAVSSVRSIFIYFAPVTIFIISIRIMIFLTDVQGFLTHLTSLDVGYYILLLAVFLGIEVISHVPAILHTPLMSGANAIHGVVIIGKHYCDGPCITVTTTWH